MLAAFIAAVMLAASLPRDPPVARAGAPGQSPVSIAEFRPSLHGFRFVNHFEGSPLPAPLQGAAKGFRVPSTFGLCGGMSFGAADFFLSRTPIPGATTPPADGSPLYEYIYARQTTSLGPALAYAPKFAQWMTLPDLGPDGTMRRTLDQLPAIRERLDHGRFAVLGLVLGGPRTVLWQNHQVLAYAMSPGGTSEVDIRIYDPNFPGRDDAVIHAAVRPVEPRTVPIYAGLALPRPTFGMACQRLVPGRPSTAVRGLFLMPYSPVAPARDLGG